MNMLIFQEDRAYIKQQLEQGEIDYVEAVSEAAETEFFQYINCRGILEELAATYPLQPAKMEVPLWLYIASEISLKLHGANSFHSYPFVIRTGGLINALGPRVGKKVVHPETGRITLHCPGFNKKNSYDRQTPCDQDFLRKTARATEAEALEKWYNTQIPLLMEKHGMFDDEGIFIGDASYIFVPDNENYEGSVVLLFDEHNHPVNKDELTSERLKRCSYKRCYKWVTLIHTNLKGEFFFFVGARVASGKAHECPILYEMVEEFLETVGKGVMKWLTVDRGFLDGANFSRLKKKWEVDTLSGLKSNMEVLRDARGLLKLGNIQWQNYHSPQKERPEPFAPKPEEIEKREKTRQRTLKSQGKWPRSPQPEKVVAFNNLTSWDACETPLTVVLTKCKDREPWGLVTTHDTRDAPFLRRMYHVRGAIEERYRQTKLFWDLTGFHSPNFNLVVNQVVFVAMAYTLLQMHLVDDDLTELAHKTRTSLRYQLLPYADHIIVYHKQRFAFFSVPEYTGIIIDIEGEAKQKLKRTMRRLQREFLHGLKRPRSP